MKSLVLEYVKTHENWREELAGFPYNLIIKDDGDYTLFKYNQIADTTDWHSPLVQEARGIILDTKEMKVVSWAFNRFFNAGEDYAADIDWKSARITEKVDGSIIKVWYDKDLWHISTNGSIDAFKVPLITLMGDEIDQTFGELVSGLMGAKWNALPRDQTHIFELTSPWNTVVISYNRPARLTYLGSRDMNTFEEVWNPFVASYFYTPEIYDAGDFMAVRALVDSFDGSRNEGVVVCDKYHNRVKIKNAEYLLLSKATDKLTPKFIVQKWKDNELDEVKAILYQNENAMMLIEKIEKALEKIGWECMLEVAKCYSSYGRDDAKRFALDHKGDPCFSILMTVYKKEIEAIEFMRDMPAGKLLDLIRMQGE